ncbi:MAG: hypothetical protein A3F90_02815 [Deltaproteobacteria bacterium RIFCSPLOWO2_12_FULL_60_19]|nr:MAG: hypothetical protein A3F90_02815 [Deltaproteobacteria bacterium RIFCSPLOWO2_12_FULL_60_19]
MWRFTLQSTGKGIDFTPERVIIAGYTGRNQEEVRAHIKELAAQGIPAPAETPTIFRTTLDRLTTGGEIEVLGGNTAGEAEVILLVKGDDVWVAVGSDHTDRELEKSDIPVSKQVCPKPVGAEVWSYAELRDRWDNLTLRSWVGESGRERLYQQGRMSALLRPEDLLAILRRRLGKLVDGAAIYTGTIPLIGGAFAFKPYFEAELCDESAGRSLRCQYRIQPVQES